MGQADEEQQQRWLPPSQRLQVGVVIPTSQKCAVQGRDHRLQADLAHNAIERIMAQHSTAQVTNIECMQVCSSYRVCS